MATVDYRLTPLFGGRIIRLTRHASSQLNQREGVAALPPPQTIPIAMITISPTSNILPTTNITFSDSLSTGTITAREWQLNNEAITTTMPSRTFPAGNHVVHLRVRDANGQWSEWVQATFGVTAASTVLFYDNPGTFNTALWRIVGSGSAIADGTFIDLGSAATIRGATPGRILTHARFPQPTVLTAFFGHGRVLDITFRAQLSAHSVGRASWFGIGDTLFIRENGTTRVTVNGITDMTPTSLGTGYAGIPHVFRIRISAINFDTNNLRAEFFINGTLKHTLYGALTGGAGEFGAEGLPGTRLDWARIESGTP